VRRILAFFFIVCLTSCSKQNESLDSNQPILKQKVVKESYQVSESFNVGTNVFVRALSLVDGSLWVGTSVGVLQIDVNNANVLKTITRENGLANEYVFAIQASKDSGVWFGTNGGGVSRIEKNNWLYYMPMHGLADYWVYSFAEQKNKAMWIGTWDGLSRYDLKSGNITTYVKELLNEWVYGLAIDSKERVWIGSEGGVNMYDGVKWHAWTHQEGLGGKNKNSLSFSANTGLGTRSRHNLSVLSNGEESYNPNYVFCVAVEKKNDHVWAGTWGGGVSQFDGQRWNNITSEDGLAGDIVYSIALDKNDVLWFGTNKGISRYDKHEWQTIDKKSGLLDNHVYAIVVDETGKVWAGSRNGVTIIEKKEI